MKALIDDIRGQMWRDDSEDCSKEQGNEKIHFRSTSPPLQGGESLCEFYLEEPEKRERLKSLQMSPLTENFHDGLLNTPSNLQNDAFHSLGEEKFPGKNFISLFNQELLRTNTFTQTFLQSILSSVDSGDPVVANAWMETLLDVIDLLPKEIVKGEILTLAVNKGQLSQPVSSRLLCCRMLGKMCRKFDPYVIVKEVLPVVLSLCQDVDFEVRGLMCRQLDVIAKGIGVEATKSTILPELVELANDEETFVRLAGIETVIQMLPILDDETCKQTIIPLVKKFLENSFSSKDFTLPVVSKHLGQLCHGLVSNFTDEQKQWFLQFFKDLSQLGIGHPEKRNSCHFNPMPDLLPEIDHKDRFRECRRACAFNFPAMVLFASPENFERELHSTLKELCADPFPSVRQTVASGFFQVARLLESSAHLLHPELVLLLHDESVEVLKRLIPMLPETLKTVCYKMEEKSEGVLVRALVACEEATSITSNWRLHADLLSSLSCLPHCISAETIFITFVPLLFGKLHTARPIPCRSAAAYSLLVILRSTPSLERRKGIINELIRELCYGKSCHKRMLFLRVCQLLIELFSKSFFKTHFFKPLLSLSADRVPNIRLCLCSILPRLKSLLKLPKDSHLLQELESSVKTLMSGEKDKDVAAAVTKAIEELDKIEVATESVSRPRSVYEPGLDVEDWQKENEELQLLMKEFSSESSDRNKLPKTAVLGNATNRSGKIPIRKSGTLPKTSKGTVEKVPTSTLKSSRSVDKERRISSPGLTPEIEKHISKSIQASKSDSINTASKTTRCGTQTWPRQKWASNIPKHQIVDRCPSPMPPRRQVDDPNATVVPKIPQPRKTNEVKRRSKCTHSSSPDVLRKSATFSNLSSESKIPTSSPRRRSTIKD